MRDEIEAVRERDRQFTTVWRWSLALNIACGVAFGLLLALAPAVQGSIHWPVVATLCLASSAALVTGAIARFEIILSMILYPAVMMPVTMGLWTCGAFTADGDILFCMTLVICMGTSGSYVCGWIRSQVE